MGKEGNTMSKQHSAALPAGWRVSRGQDYPDGRQSWRIIESLPARMGGASVVDGRYTEEAALRRAWQIIHNRDKNMKRWLEAPWHEMRR